jgi:hypothetical protein
VRAVTAGRSIRTRHDEWVKRALSRWFEGLGDLQIDVRIAGEGRRGDVLFSEKGNNPDRRRRLGVLGELARGIVLFEPFRNPLTAHALTTCVIKALELTAERARAARRARKKQSTVETTLLCAITPSMSADLMAEVEATPLDAQRPGVYRLAPVWHTVIVIVDRLSVDASTMWLRLLGRGQVQARAVQDLLELSAQDPLRNATLQLLVAWQQSLPPPGQQSEDEREMTMNLEQVYERWERKVKAEGKREGKAVAVVAVLESRGLEMTAAQRKQVLGCTEEAQLDAWLRAASTAPSVKALLSSAAQPRGRNR